MTRVTTRYICVIRWSFRKSFTARGYEVVHFNRFGSRWRAMWNGLCPSLATSNELVFRKSGRREAVTIVVSRSAADVCVGLSGARSAHA